MVDYSEESHHDSLIRNTLIQTVLGISHSLGYSGDAYQRSFASMIAWMTLQLRNCVVLTTMAVNIKVPRQNSSDQKMTGYEDPEAVRILAGSVRWCLDFLCWIIDSLIHPPESPLKDGKALADLSIDELNAYLFSTKNVALHLLLSSSTRGFLIAICRRLIHLDYTARKTLSSTVNSDPQGSQASIVSNSLRASYTAIASLKQNSIVPVEIFDTFVNTIAQLMKDTYLTHNQPVMKQLSDAPGQVNRNTIEAQVLCGGELPASFALAISKILNEALPKLKKEIDAAQLFFHSYAGLNLPLSDASLLGSNASSSLALASKARTKNAEHRVRHTIDIFCRRPIEVGRGAGNGPHDRRYRRCARCGAAMEDIASRQHVIQFLVMQQRRCFCSGSWNVLQGGRVVA